MPANLLTISASKAIDFELEVKYSCASVFLNGEFGRQNQLNPRVNWLFSLMSLLIYKKTEASATAI